MAPTTGLIEVRPLQSSEASTMRFNQTALVLTARDQDLADVDVLDGTINGGVYVEGARKIQALLVVRVTCANRKGGVRVEGRKVRMVESRVIAV